MAPPAGDVSRELQESIRRALGRPRIHLLLRARLETKPRRLEERILAEWIKKLLRLEKTLRIMKSNRNLTVIDSRDKTRQNLV